MISGEMENVQETPLPQPAFSATEATAQSPAATGTMQSRNSKAIPIWLAVIVAVLGGLYMQTQTSAPSYNFLIEGDSQSSGATVRIDGQQVGELGDLSEGGVRSTGLRLHLPDGSHEVVVSKPGFAPSSATVVVKGEQYLSVRLKALQQQK